MRPDSRRVHYYNVRSGLTCNHRLISAWVMDLTYQLPGLAEASFDVEGADLKEALSGTLRIGFYAPIAPAFLPSILSSFVPSSGAVTLHLDECDNDAAQDGLLNGVCDVILVVSEDVRPTIEFDVLIKAPAYCLLPREHPLAAAESATMAQVVREPLVVLQRPFAANYYKGLFDRYADISVAAYANSTEMVRSLVSAGHGCAVLNIRPMTSTSYCGAELAGLPISDPLPPLTLAIGYDKSRPRRLVRHFIDACHAHFTETGPQQCIVERQVG